MSLAHVAHEKAMGFRRDCKASLRSAERAVGDAKRKRHKVLSEFRDLIYFKTDSESGDSEPHFLPFNLPLLGLVAEVFRIPETRRKVSTEFTMTHAVELLKEGLSVTSLESLENKFVTQLETRAKLDHLLEKVSRQLFELREEKDRLEKERGQLKNVQRQPILQPKRDVVQASEEIKVKIKEMEERKFRGEIQLTQAGRLLVDSKEALYHILLLLHHHLPNDEDPLPWTPDAPVLDLLQHCKVRMERLKGLLKDHDLPKLKEQMNKTKFQQKLEEKITEQSRRLRKPKTPTVTSAATITPAGGQESSSTEDEDDPNLVSRTYLKKQAQQFAQMKMKQKSHRKQILVFK